MSLDTFRTGVRAHDSPRRPHRCPREEALGLSLNTYIEIDVSFSSDPIPCFLAPCTNTHTHTHSPAWLSRSPNPCSLLSLLVFAPYQNIPPSVCRNVNTRVVASCRPPNYLRSYQNDPNQKHLHKYTLTHTHSHTHTHTHTHTYTYTLRVFDSA
jgi:hypothetical protein